MRKIIAIIALQIYAVVLAILQAQGGVRTDEAKYLLDIPYPHPPLARWLMGLTDGMPYQELFWRIVFASLVVQAVWIVWTFEGRGTKETKTTGNECQNPKFKCQKPRIWHLAFGIWHFPVLLSLLWLSSAGVLLGAGSIMMAPLTALQGILLCRFWMRNPSANHATWIAILWLISLFTAYQAVLFFPIVAATLWRLHISRPRKIILLFGPLLLLALFTLSQPLLLASMLLTGGGTGIGWDSFLAAFQLWLFAGSVVLSLLSLSELFHKRYRPIAISLLLVFVYISLEPRTYYLPLFLPFIVSGTALALQSPRLSRRYRTRAPSFALLIVVLLGTWMAFLKYPPPLREDASQSAMEAIAREEPSGIILIHGSFGHQWQYRSPVPVRRFRKPLLSEASAVVCLEECGEMGEGWRRLEGVDVEVWVNDQIPMTNE